MKGRATFNSEKRMLKLISGFVNIAFELVSELEYYRNKNFKRPFYSHLKEHVKEEIIHSDFGYCSLAGEELIRFIRAIALVAHQCCMYKLHISELDGMILEPSSFPDRHNSFASAFEKVNEREWTDEDIIDEMDKLARIVS